MKIKLIIIALFVTSSVTWAQHKVEKCNKLQTEKQKSCKDNLIADMVSNYAVYPDDALNNAHEGLVYMRFTTDENRNLQSVRSLGNYDEELAEAAKSAIEKFARSDAKEILAKNEVYRIPVKFELE